MIFEVAIGDRVRTVGIVRKGGLLHVDVDGRSHVVDARRVGDSAISLLMLEGDATASRSVDAAFASRPAPGDFDVHLDGRTISLQIRPAGSFGRQKKDGPGGSGSGPQRVLAPIVKPGDEVKARQGLVVVEAMKMENELRAARDGRVRDIAVAEGQSVDAGAVLLVVE
jgi:hypothetical protein